MLTPKTRSNPPGMSIFSTRFSRPNFASKKDDTNRKNDIEAIARKQWKESRLSQARFTVEQNPTLVNVKLRYCFKKQNTPTKTASIHYMNTPTTTSPKLPTPELPQIVFLITFTPTIPKAGQMNIPTPLT